MERPLIHLLSQALEGLRNMPSVSSIPTTSTVLIAGASRGLGLAMAIEFANRGWSVIGTVRSSDHTELHDLANRHPDRVEVESLDVDDPHGIAGLRDRLANRTLGILFVNAGTTTRDEHVHAGLVSTEEFMRVMMTNVLGPMRVIEALEHLVPANGLIGAMSSGQGSITNNEIGGRDVYRASKAALNMSMRSFAARQSDVSRAMVLLAPGWIRTELGGPEASYTIEESVPLLVDILLSECGNPGLRYLDRFHMSVPW